MNWRVSDCTLPRDQARGFCERFSWLDFDYQKTEYLHPEYYLRLLKPYVFDGLSDIELFGKALHHAKISPGARVLELGAGTGRSVATLLTHILPRELVLLDQSRRMISYLQEKSRVDLSVSYQIGDAIEYLNHSTKSYDLVYSLWSLSHAIHQTIANLGISRGTGRVSLALNRLFREILAPNGYLVLIHFDSTSEEQTISMRQRSKQFSFLRPGEHSPSKLLIDSVVEDLAGKHVITFERKRYIGAPIVYRDINEALEIFMNFHMEGAFNRFPHVESVITDLTKDLQRFCQADGTITIQPACFVYECRRI